MGYGSAEKNRIRDFGNSRKLKKKIAQRTRKGTGQLKACSSTLTERMLCRSSKNLLPPIISCNTSFYDNNPIKGILTL
jgi:hypothetical protein